MKKQNRVNEILSQMTSFSKESYTKEEYLPEMLKLQQEMVDIAYAGKCSEEKLTLWDVGEHLKSMNKKCNGVADFELHTFIKKSKIVGNSIKAEISGNKGEQIVFSELKKLNCNNSILRNIEFELDGKRTEIDAIVFTHRAIFIIEIKNSKKNIFIDEDGDFYRTGNSMHYDGNIAEKMSEREMMLRKVLDNMGLGYLKIFNILTFTNSRIDVENKYHRIKMCRSNYIAHFIENFYSDHYYSNESISAMVSAVEEAKCKEGYRMLVDMNEFKADFANLIAELESTEETNKTEPVQVKKIKQKEKVQKILDNKIIQSEKVLSFRKGIIAASVGFAIGFGVLLKSIR